MFSSTKEQYPSLFGKRFNLCRSQNDVQNTKAFSQQTISTKIKRNNRMDQSTLFDTGFNKSNVAIHRQPLFFFILTKSQPFNKKQPTGTIIQIIQSRQTIHNLSNKNIQKTNLQNKHDKLSNQSIVKSITKKPQQTTHTISR